MYYYEGDFVDGYKVLYDYIILAWNRKIVRT